MFGRRAGLGAAEYANEIDANTLNMNFDQITQHEKHILAPFSNTGGKNPYTVHQNLQEIMQNYFGVFRIKDKLEQGLKELEALIKDSKVLSVEGSRMFNPGWNLSVDLNSLFVVAEAAAKCALQREESRGAHSRVDFPESDDTKWNKVNSVISQDGDNMKLGLSPLPEMPDELKSLFSEDS